MQKRYHLIAIGGSVMHNVALDLADLGNEITGSDDEIYEPSKSRLLKKGLLPDKIGWDSDRIDDSIDAIILGKHARNDNPELLKAQSLGIPIYSFPEFVASKSKATKRVCISGSHGKTSTTAMIMHVLKYHDYDFDYLVGANLDGFDKMVKLSDSDILVVEGDEYPSSCLDMRAKMLHYRPNIAVITGIAWDHVNIYKTYKDYKNIFRDFLNGLQKDAICFFDQTDSDLNKMMINEVFPPKRQSYNSFETNKKGEIIYNGQAFPISIFGNHNLKNLKAAYHVCQSLGIENHAFFEAIANFKGAAKRLELIFESERLTVYKDFAHAPSKCEATVNAVKGKYQNKNLTAILELHTFSSLDKSFITQYAETMSNADKAFVYFDPNALKMKQMPDLDPEFVAKSFKHPNIEAIDNSKRLQEVLESSKTDETEVLLIMSSGSLGGFDLTTFF
ncbi:MAG: peptidoglycan synthetase [Bacteroidia bacterium]|nr:peptidoglycan synthetase [Bacteroidia bacterium]